MIRDLTPLLAVKDVPAACAFMADCLGFETRAAFDGFAYCARGNGAIRFVKAPADHDMDNPARQVMVYLDAEDADVLWAAHSDQIMTLPESHRQAPADTPHGQREFVIVHDHIAVVVGSPMIRRPKT